MICEIVYGKDEGSRSCRVFASAPKECGENVSERFPLLPKLVYPWKTPVNPKPIAFCYTICREKKQTVLSCLRCGSSTSSWFYYLLKCQWWWAADKYLSQHLIIENEFVEAGPVWLLRRRKSHVETKYVDWSKPLKIDSCDWKPHIPLSNYCIGLEDKVWGDRINEVIERIAQAWNEDDYQEKRTRYVLLFDPKQHDDPFRLDLLYDLYARVKVDRRWWYQFCTFDGPRPRKALEPPQWEIVFVAERDTKTFRYYKNQGYRHESLKGK